MARPTATATDTARLARLDAAVHELDAAERRLDELRSKRNKLIYQLMESRVISASNLSDRARVSEPYVYRCLHDKGEPRTGAAL